MNTITLEWIPLIDRKDKYVIDIIAKNNCSYKFETVEMKQNKICTENIRYAELKKR